MTDTTKVVYTFAAAADAAITCEKKAGGLWQNLAGFIATLDVGTLVGEDKRQEVATLVKGNENLYAVANPKASKLSTIVAYRTAKSTCLKAIELNVTLIDANGKVRGKSEVEKEIAEGKTEKTAMEKFRIIHTSLASVADKLLTESEVKEAMLCIEDTYAKLAAFHTSLKESAKLAA